VISLKTQSLARKRPANLSLCDFKRSSPNLSTNGEASKLTAPLGRKPSAGWSSWGWRRVRRGDNASGFQEAMSARLAFLILGPAAAGAMYVATFPPEWQWHAVVAAAGIVVVMFLGLRSVLKKRK
jgi:hypothetical protein